MNGIEIFKINVPLLMLRLWRGLNIVPSPVIVTRDA